MIAQINLDNWERLRSTTNAIIASNNYGEFPLNGLFVSLPYAITVLALIGVFIFTRPKPWGCHDGCCQDGRPEGV